MDLFIVIVAVAVGVYAATCLFKLFTKDLK